MNYYDRPIRNTEQQLDHIYYTLFHRCLNSSCCGFSPQPWKLCGAKTLFPEPNRHTLDFDSSNFTVQDHILSTTGDALTLHLDHATNFNFKERKREREKKEGKKAQIVWNLQAKCYERTKNLKLPFGSLYNPKKETPLPHTSSLPQFILFYFILSYFGVFKFL
jgi:hypothetical protein